MRRLVSQELFGFLYGSEAMGNIPRALRTVNYRYIPDGGIVGGQILFEIADQKIKSRAVPHRGIVHRIKGFHVFRPQGQLIHLKYIVDIGEIPRVITRTIDDGAIMIHELYHKFRNHRSIRPVRRLPPTEDIEIAQADAFQPIGFTEHISIKFIHIFGNGIRREGFPNDVFHFGQSFGIAVGGGTRGIDKTLHFGIPRGHQHIEKATHIHVIARNGIVNGTRHGPQRRLMQDIILPSTGLVTSVYLPDIALYQREVRMLL